MQPLEGTLVIPSVRQERPVTWPLPGSQSLSHGDCRLGVERNCKMGRGTHTVPWAVQEELAGQWPKEVRVKEGSCKDRKNLTVFHGLKRRTHKGGGQGCRKQGITWEAIQAAGEEGWRRRQVEWGQGFQGDPLPSVTGGSWSPADPRSSTPLTLRPQRHAP